MSKKDVKYTVSVRLMTYMHAPFIKEAMDGIMMQKTDFKFEVVVGDDFSTDGTLDIIRTYSETKNVHIKILKREKGDAYWQKRQELGRLYNFINILENCSGKYVALLDGDDYWTDPLKLQKQVDFLEENEDYSMCFHKAKVISEASTMTTNIYDHLEEKEYSGEEILNQWSIPTASVMFRNRYDLEILSKPNKDILFGDILLFLFLATKGKLFCLKDEMSVYRRNGQGVSVKGRFTSKRKLIHYKTLYQLLQPNFKNALENLVIKYLIKVIHYELDNRNFMQGFVYSKELLFLRPKALKDKVLKKRIKNVLNFN
ncbi:glycosyltransferase [Psychroflexus tropicus]|uniref:glycosyltransferase n=1 Tax=Psychroflexus tropicus TaxID=197345 RepID=UPI00037BB528|nr:glycosyltransferase [Psychroflexus tropicus]